MLHQLGAGTLGPVFRAYDPDADRLVAIKLFTLDLPPQRVHQLVDEFQTLVAAELTHPAIAAPVAAGIAGVQAYLAQDFVAGDSLDLAIREYGPAPAGDAIRVATQLAGALDFAAVVGITHGALHPRDILISGEDTHLTGLGIATALERIGVPAPVRRPYTAPERVSGRGWQRRADVFSLAVLMHELLTGRRITAMGGQAAAALAEVKDADMTALRALFARALSEDPNDRFATALEFAEALKDAFPDATLLTAAAANADASVAETDRVERERSRGERRPAEELPTVRRLPLSDPEPMPPLAVHAADDLPIAPVNPETDETIPMPPPAAVPASPVAPIEELDLRTAEQARFADVESAPSIPQVVMTRRVDTDETVADSEQPTVAEKDQPTVPAGVLTASDVSSTLNDRPARGGSMLATLVIGVVLGFGAGYLVGRQLFPAATHPAPPAQAAPPQASSPASEAAPRPPAPPQPAPSQATPPAAQPPAQAPREFTESAVPPAAAPARPQTDQPSNPGRILVRSTPAGATVFVDGREAGRTPIAVRDLANGTHRVRIEREGFVSDERRVAITRSRPAQSLTVTLRSSGPPEARISRQPAPVAGAANRYAGSLMVESRPTGANVFVDNRLLGKTPLSIAAIDAGEHVVRIEHDGYRRWTGQVRVIAAERTRVTASLDEGR